MSKCKSVKQFYDGRSVFITGGSGFIGRVLIEKLLRTYPGIQRLYVLLRAKKGQNPQVRLHKELLSAPIFDKIKSMSNGEKILDKIVLISGDISQPGLGISSKDREMMLNDKTLSIVIHSAATVKFDEPLNMAIALNVIATREVAELCRSIPNLVSFCHVSSAYVNSDIKDGRQIEEEVYPMDLEPQDMIELTRLLKPDMMQQLKAQILADRPNTYTFTKALAEKLLIQEASDLPLVIVRPSIVGCAWKDPMPGWVDNLNGPSGLIVAIGKGVTRSLNVNVSVKSDIIPVDIVVNCMIASIYKYAREASVKCSEEQVPVIHCNSGQLNPLFWGRIERCTEQMRCYPSATILRCPGGYFWRSYWLDYMINFVLCFIPALLIDMMLKLAGQKPMLVKVYQKVMTAFESLRHFTIQTYEFRSDNLKKVRDYLEDDQDKADLYMDVENIKWLDFWDSYILGTRRYVLKESDSTLEQARKFMNRAYWIEMVFYTLLLASIACWIWSKLQLPALGIAPDSFGLAGQLNLIGLRGEK